MATMPLFLVTCHHGDEHARYAVHASTNADALARVRAAHPEHRARLRVAVSVDTDVLPLPSRGRPPRPARAISADHQAFLHTVPGWSEIL